MAHQTLIDIALKLELQREAQRRAKDKGVGIVWTKETYPYTDGYNVYLPSLEGVKITDKTKNLYKAYLIHEPLHINRRELLIKCHEKNLSEVHTYLVNVVEDELMEANHVLKHHVPGDGMVLNSMIEDEIKRMADAIEINPSALVESDLQMKAWAALMGMYHSRATTWYKNSNTANLINKIASYMPKGLREVYDYVCELAKNGELYKNLDIEHSWNTAEDLYNRFFASEDKKQKKQQQQQESSEDGQESSDCSKEGNGKGQLESANEDAEQQKEGIKKLIEQNINETIDKHNKTTIKLKTYTPENTEGSKSSSAKLDLADAEIDLQGLQEKGTLVTYPINAHIIKTVDEVYDECDKQNLYFNSKHYDKIINKINALTPSLGTRLKRLLLIKSKASLKGAQKTGKLHNKNLFRAAMPVIGNGDWNTRIFKQRHIKDTLDTSVHILMDFSGSMCGEKFVAASIGVGVLSNVLTTLKIPHSIYGYTTNYGNVFREHTEIHDPIAKKRGVPVTIRIKGEKNKAFKFSDVVYKLCHLEYVMQQNADADSLLYVASEAKKSPRKRKIIIVISDGAPTLAYTNSKRCEPILRDAVKLIENDPAYEIGAIGIGRGSGVPNFYSNHSEISVNAIDTLPEAIVDLFKKLILSKKGVQ